MQVLKRVAKWALCCVGYHWSGEADLGMYGDAARCDLCGRDAYGLYIRNKGRR
jgi:hypothetical protein